MDDPKDGEAPQRTTTKRLTYTHEPTMNDFMRLLRDILCEVDPAARSALRRRLQQDLDDTEWDP